MHSSLQAYQFDLEFLPKSMLDIFLISLPSFFLLLLQHLDCKDWKVSGITKGMSLSHYFFFFKYSYSE